MIDHTVLATLCWQSWADEAPQPNIAQPVQATAVPCWSFLIEPPNGLSYLRVLQAFPINVANGKVPQVAPSTLTDPPEA